MTGRRIQMCPCMVVDGTCVRCWVGVILVGCELAKIAFEMTCSEITKTAEVGTVWLDIFIEYRVPRTRFGGSVVLH